MADNIRISMPVTVNIASAKTQLDAFISLYERRGITLATNISSINNQLREQGTILGSNGQILSSVNRTNTAIAQQGSVAQNTGRQVNGLASSMRNMTMENERSAQSAISVLGKIAMWTALTTAVFAPIKTVKDMINTIYEIDTAIVNLKKVSDELGESVGIKEFTKDMNEMAIAVGHSTTAAINSVTEFKRLGYTLKEAQILGEQSLIYSNIGDLSIEDSTKSIISTLAGFQLGVEDVNHVMDAYNEVGNNFSITSAGIGKALQRSSSSLYEANNTIEESIGLIVAGNSSVQNVEKVGNGLKTVSMRIRGVSEETGEAIPQLDGLVKRLTGVDMMKDENTFKSTYDIMVEISKVWKDLEDVSRATLLDKLFGKHQGAVGASILNNMSVGIQAMETATNSLGSSAKEQAAYMDSLKAKVNTFKESATNLYINTISPETLKSMVQFGTQAVELIDKVGLLNVAIIGLYLSLGVTGKITAFNTAIRATAVALAYTGQATEIATRQTINYGARSVIATQQLRNNIIILRASALAMNAVSVAARGLKLAFMVLWPLVLFEGALLLYRHFKKIEEQTEATRKAFNQFNTDIKDFQDTLDPNKIDEVSNSLEKLKEATNYDENIKEIEKLKKSIYSLESTPATIDGNTSGLIEMQKNQLSDLEDKVELVTNAQKRYDEQKKIAIALDYQSVQEGNKKIASKIRENEANRQLIDSYQSVHDKMIQGNELTQEEYDLNQKMIDKYPEYTQRLNSTTHAIGIKIESLKSNMTAQEALARIEFDTMQTTAKASKLATNGIIKSTESRIDVITAEIRVLEGLSKTYSSLAESPVAAASFLGKSFQKNNDALKSEASKSMAEANTILNRAKSTYEAWDTLANMSIEDLQKGTPKFKGSSGSESGNKSSSKNDPSYSDTTDSLIRQIQAQSVLTSEKSKAIQTEISQAKSEKDYQKELELTTSLLSNQELQIKQLGLAKSALESEFSKTSSQSGFSDTSTWFDSQGEASLTYLSKFNSSTKETQEKLSSTFDSLQKLQKAWGENGKTIDKLTQSQNELKISLSDLSKTLAKEVIETSKELAKSALDSQEKQLNSFKTASETIIKGLQSQIDALEEKNDLEQESEERAKRLLDISKAQQALNDVLKERTARIYVEGQGWTWQANPEKVQSATEKLQDLQTDYQSWEKQQTLNHQKDALQDQIKYQQDLIKSQEDSFNIQKSIFDEQWKNLDSMSTKLLDQFGTNVDNATKVLAEKLIALNAQLAAINSGSMTMPSSLQFGSSSNSSYYAGTTYNGVPVDDGSAIYNNWKANNFDTGGETQRTGLHWLDGKIGKPERVLSSEQNNSFTKLIDMLPKLNMLSNISIPKMPQFNPVLSGNNTPSINNNYTIKIDRVVTENVTDFMNQLKRIVRS